MNDTNPFSLNQTQMTMAKYITDDLMITGAMGKWRLAISGGGGNDAPRFVGGWDEFRGTNGAVDSADKDRNWTKWINGASYPGQTNYLVSQQHAGAEDWIIQQHNANKICLCCLAFQAPYELYYRPLASLFKTPLPSSNDDCKDPRSSGVIK